MIRWLLENLGLILLALVIAAVVWIAAEWDRDRIVEGDYDQLIPIKVQHQPPGTHLVEGWQQDVRVRLRAPESVWDELSLDQFVAVVNLSPNLSPLDPDLYSLRVNVTLNDADPATIVQVEPEWIEIEIEEIREQSVPIEVDVRGEPDLGYEAGDTTIMSNTVTIRGPASQVDQVAKAVSNLSLQGARGNIEQDVTLIPVDVAGRRVSNVSLNPAQVRVRIPVKQQPNFRQMAVNVEILGEPAQDYRVTSVTYSPSVVSIQGSPGILADLPGVLRTIPFSIEGRTEDTIERLPLDLPPGVSVVNPDDLAVQVTIEIEPLPGSVTVTRTLTYQGLQPDLIAEASPEEVEIILSGPRPRLSSLLPEDVRVILDLSDMRQGDEDQLEPVVVAPEGITVESIIPPVIQIRAVRKPPPTPTPTSPP